MITFCASAEVRKSIALKALSRCLQVREIASPLPNADTACFLPRHIGAMSQPKFTFVRPDMTQKPLAWVATFWLGNAWSPPMSGPMSA